MGPLPNYQVDSLRWPAWVTKVYAQANPLLWLALFLTVALAPVVGKVLAS